MLGCTVVFSTAMQKTGISDTLARDILNLFGNNPYIVMAVMCLLLYSWRRLRALCQISFG